VKRDYAWLAVAALTGAFAVVTAGVAVVAFQPASGSLEATFLQLTEEGS
jgi:hypothetical protein